MKLLDLPSEAHRQFRFCWQMPLQSFPDFVADCSAVPVLNINGVSHGQIRSASNLLKGHQALTSTLPLNEG
jgi:hypothetical protein